MAINQGKDMKPAIPESSDHLRNDDSLGSRLIFPLKFPGLKQLGIELGSAFGASLAVSPLVTIIDSAIYKNASGSQTLLRSLASGVKEFVISPITYLRSVPVLIMLSVYGVTYTTANLVDGLASLNQFDSLYPKMASTSIVNISACVFKDVLYTQMYGNSASSKVPKSSLALYFGRDILTLCATFGIPEVAASYFGKRGFDPGLADNVAQIASPCVVQLIATPMHLLAINLYNCPESTLRDRYRFLRSEYLNNTAVKTLRGFFAFGIGGMANRKLRAYGYSLIKEEPSTQVLN